jgi:hypothetical protein
LGQRKYHWLVCAGLIVATFAIALRAQPASADVAYGVTENGRLVWFGTTQFANGDIGSLSGMFPGDQILAIDVRPQTGRLYGVSASRLYLINTVTAQVQLVSETPFPAPLSGSVDIDFDPVTGVIRVVTSTNQNLRINPDTAAVTTDTPISGVTGLAGVGYTNNFASPDRSTLFAISPSTDQLVRIGNIEDPVNGGTSQAGGAATAVGGLTLDVGTVASLDIAANDNEAFAVMSDPDAVLSSFYKVSLVTGAATLIKPISTPGARIRSFALVTRAVKLYALAKSTVDAPAGAIVSVLSPAPGTFLPQPGGGPVPIAGGMGVGEEVTDIATRPATGDLIGLTNVGRLVQINPATGESTAMSLLSIPVDGAPRVMDFSPFDNLLHIIGDNGQHLSVVADTGAATAGTAFAETGLIAGAFDAAGTLWAMTNGQVLSYDLGDLVSGVGEPIAAVSAIYGPGTAMAISPADGAAFILQDALASSAVRLQTLSLHDGVPSGLIGQFPSAGGLDYRGLAVASQGRVQFGATGVAVNENGGVAPVTLQRVGGTSGVITVQLSVAAGTAMSPADFIGFTSSVTFADGENIKVLNVPIINDSLDENDETVGLLLAQTNFNSFLPSVLGTPTGTFFTIVDNDSATPGGDPSITITSPTADPTYNGFGRFITLAGMAADADGTVASIAWTTDRGFSGTASMGAAAASVEWYATDIPLAVGVNNITVTVTDNQGNTGADSIGVTTTQMQYYLAEGATGTFFDLDLLLANPNQVPVEIDVVFLKPLGQGTVVQQYTLPPTSRTTINVETIAGLENAEVSTIVTAPAETPIVVERTMRWNETGYGAHTDKASPSTSQKWYFAEGSQGFFFTYLLLANPQNAANQATVKYLRENTTPVTRTYDLAPLQRFTVDIGADADLVNQSFGMEVTFTLPGIAERAMYFGLSPLWIGGHESVGVTQPSRNWFLAEGATGTFFETFVLFANPSASDASVAVRYLPDTGVPVDKTYPVPAGQRLTINIQGEDPALVSAAVATQVTSNVPIIVERAQYWPDPAPSWYEAHNSFGVTSTGTRWGLAEGRVGLNTGYQTYILLANPNANEVNVSITFLREDGTTVTKPFTVQPSSRFNVAVGGADVPEITNERFSAVITASHPIAVERAMYSDQAGVTWQAGTNATATRLPDVP